MRKSTLALQDEKEHIPEFLYPRKDLFKIMVTTGPGFYSQIYYAAYVIVKSLKHIFWELSDYLYIILERINEKIFIKYV